MWPTCQTLFPHLSQSHGPNRSSVASPVASPLASPHSVASQRTVVQPPHRRRPTSPSISLSPVRIRRRFPLLFLFPLAIASGAFRLCIASVEGSCRQAASPEPARARRSCAQAHAVSSAALLHAFRFLPAGPAGRAVARAVCVRSARLIRMHASALVAHGVPVSDPSEGDVSAAQPLVASSRPLPLACTTGTSAKTN